MRKLTIGIMAVAAAMSLGAQDRESFLRQQAYAEMQRVTGQLDVLQSNFNDLNQRVNRLEGGNDTRALRSEIEALKAAVAELRSELRGQRGEIVRDLSQKLVKMQPPAESRPAAQPKTVVVGPHFEYTVQKGDTLSLIAQAFNTSVKKIREMNTLKGDSLRVGQKINVPKE